MIDVSSARSAAPWEFLFIDTAGRAVSGQNFDFVSVTNIILQSMFFLPVSKILELIFEYAFYSSTACSFQDADYGRLFSDILA